MIIKLIEFFMPGGLACENVTDIELVRLVHKPYMITQTLGGKVTYRVPKKTKISGILNLFFLASNNFSSPNG